MGIYIRADKRKNKTYYWLVEGRREGNKVVQRRIRSLGTEPPTGKRLEELERVIREFERTLHAANKPPTKEQTGSTTRRRK